MRHTGSLTPSPWVTRFASRITAGGEVLDLACGSGRHARWLASRGFRVEAVDRDAVALELLAGVPHLNTREADLEDGPWPYAGRHFDAIVVTNYLFRPRLPLLLTAPSPGKAFRWHVLASPYWYFPGCGIGMFSGERGGVGSTRAGK